MTTTTQTTNRITDSTDRTAALVATRTAGSARQLKSASARVGSAAKRLLNALMRSLATPHV
ncbi:MAG: hypothetical protein L0241_12120 [Planctomycetia bacterium]|nr:hypothetical protein [Planctomycetia bacterium]